MTRREVRPGLHLAFLALLFLCGCWDKTDHQPAGRDSPVDSAASPGEEPSRTRRSPRTDLAEHLRAALEVEHHPSDGGGRAWVESADAARAGQPGTWTIVYEAGPLGIADGGLLFFQVSPFWEWSTPQVARPDLLGYTRVSTEAEGVELEPVTLDRQLLGITVRDRELRHGERVRIVYGAGEVGARADRYAERDSRFWIAVDGDGDGIRKVLEDSPAVDVQPGAPARLLLTLPSTARPGEAVRLIAAVVDAQGNVATSFTGEVDLRVFDGDGVELPATVRLDGGDEGRKTVEVTVASPGVIRLAGRVRASGDLDPSGPGGRELEAESNPLQVSPRGVRILWGDLHNHSNFSDGTGVPEDLFLYARDVAGLDVFSLTDHDHWGMLFLDDHPEMWDELQEMTERFYAPGHFVTLLGYEWTSWIHGHRHVLYFEDEGEMWSSLDPEHETPRQLWDALRASGRRAMTVAHHSAGGPISTDWSIPPDPEFEPVTEVISVHGSSEAADSPGRIYSPVPGNFVRDALDLGYRLGFVGSSDSHDGHPGLAHLASPTGGLAAILAEDATREAIHEALQKRRVYATSGPRIILRVSFGGYPIGSAIPADPSRREGPAVTDIPAETLLVQVLAPAVLSHVDVIRSGEVVQGVDCESERRCAFALEFPEVQPEEYLYVRAVQRDGGVAWSSPFFFM